MKNANCDRIELMRYIQAQSFAADELRLFLNTHPNCKEALQDLQCVNHALNQARDKYSELYGQLILTDMECGSCYSWIEGPWPWEKEA